ncbi:hypothetical protein PBY51_014371 [Eleginops maclovinus]|uniref:Uncharacterized protein n=1 Tax=Eleginops maclovinus TaxID=56733 RepID=A0AAN8ACK1_ELEMC|nr:hypothetical protein PBY51_014371 [Eleginops maclovinus]
MSCCFVCLFHELSGARLSTSARCPDIKCNTSKPDRFAPLFNIHDVCPCKFRPAEECVVLSAGKIFVEGKRAF